MADRKAIFCIRKAAIAARAPFEARQTALDDTTAVAQLLRSCFWLLACLVSEHVKEVEADEILRTELLGWAQQRGPEL